MHRHNQFKNASMPPAEECRRRLVLDMTRQYGAPARTINPGDVVFGASTARRYTVESVNDFSARLVDPERPGETVHVVLSMIRHVRADAAAHSTSRRQTR